MTKPIPPQNAATAALVETLALSRRAGKGKTGKAVPGFAEALASLVDTSAPQKRSARCAAGATAVSGGRSPSARGAGDPPASVAGERRAESPAGGKKTPAAEDAADAGRPGRRRSREVRRQGRLRRDPGVQTPLPPGQRIVPGTTTAAETPRDAGTASASAAARPQERGTAPAAETDSPRPGMPPRAASAARPRPAEREPRHARAASGEFHSPAEDRRPEGASATAFGSPAPFSAERKDAGLSGDADAKGADSRRVPFAPAKPSPPDRTRAAPPPKGPKAGAARETAGDRDTRPTRFADPAALPRTLGKDAHPRGETPAASVRTDAAPPVREDAEARRLSAQGPGRKAAPGTGARDASPPPDERESAGAGIAASPGKPSSPASSARAPFEVPALQRARAEGLDAGRPEPEAASAARPADRPPAWGPSPRGRAMASPEGRDAPADAQGIKAGRAAAATAGEAAETPRAVQGPPAALLDPEIRPAADLPPAHAATPADAAPAGDAAPPFEQMRIRLSPLQDGVHTVELRLSPESLGDLRIDLRIRAGAMDATVRTQTPEARDLLLRDAPALRQALHDGGLTLSSFTVTVGGGGGDGDRQAARTGPGEERGARRRNTIDPAGAVEAESPPSAGRGGPDSPTHWIA